MNNPLFIYQYKISKADQLDPKIWLDPNELNRYSQMTNPKRQQEFLAARALTKSVLQQIHGLKNPKVLISKSGKPQVKKFKMNLSHSDGKIILAINQAYTIGIDLELSKDKKHIQEIAKQYFSDIEYKYIFSSKSKTIQQKRFKHLWCLKESYIKAFNGILNKKTVKIYFDLNKNEVTLTPTQKQISFFIDKKTNCGLCVVGKIKLSDLRIFQIKSIGGKSLSLKKSKIGFQQL